MLFNQTQILLVSLIVAGFISCNKETESSLLKEQPELNSLWIDQTDKYLPQTLEWTNRVELADINQDGMIDLLFANGSGYSEPGEPELNRAFINKGSEEPFEEVSPYLFGETKDFTRVIKARDLNKDGFPDIVVGNTYESQSRLLFGTGGGAYKDVTKTNFPGIKSNIGDLEIGDVDNDGDLDIVLSDWGPGDAMNNIGGRTMLWLNDGEGNFEDVTDQQMPELLIQFSWDVEFIDLENDFDLDIVISCKRCATGRTFINDGQGNFEDIRMLPAYTNNYDYEAMDINRDGFLDLVTINDGEIVDKKSWSRREHILLSDSGRRFIDATSELWPDSANVGEDDNNISFIDYDSDGDADFLISSLTGEDRLLVNDGDGKFSLLQPVLNGTPTPLTLSLVLADINNDRKIDIVMGQGEGDEGIEERIFLGDKISEDTATPIISHYQIEQDGHEMIIKARIHDNKSPNMPDDWMKIQVIANDETNTDMEWYGENLWIARIESSNHPLKICAADKAGNESCREIKKAD